MRWLAPSRAPFPVLVALSLTLAHAGCSSPMAITPPPAVATATPTPTPGVSAPAYSTLFQNVPLVRSLEEATQRRSILVALSGRSDLEGRVATDASWTYDFANTASLDGTLHPWMVRSDGAVRSLPPAFPVARDLDIAEIGPHLAVDSPDAIRLAMGYGAQRYVDSFPGSYVRMGLRFRARVATWELRFAVPPGGPACELGPIYINASTGELLDRDLDCLSRF